jgi:hypothetical protein
MTALLSGELPEVLTTVRTRPFFRLQERDRPKGGGSGGSAEWASRPALSDCAVSFECAVRDSGSNPQHHVRSPWRPAHLLTRAHPAMKQPLRGAFCRRRRYWLRVVTRCRVVDDHCRLPGHVRLQATQECTHLARRRACSRPHGGDGVERRHGIADQIKCTLHLAVPQAPTDVLHSIGEEGAVDPERRQFCPLIPTRLKINS